jgi:hypothetical protein
MKPRQTSNPKARTDGLIVQRLAGETLIYDQERHKAHCLNKTAAMVWEHCDGASTPTQIADQLTSEMRVRVTRDVVLLAIAKLSRRHLMTSRRELKASRPGLNRREVLSKLGRGAVIALPVITSILAPRAAQAATCLPSGSACSNSAECCSGLCNNNTCV